MHTHTYTHTTGRYPHLAGIDLYEVDCPTTGEVWGMEMELSCLTA